MTTQIIKIISKQNSPSLGYRCPVCRGSVKPSHEAYTIDVDGRVEQSPGRELRGHVVCVDEHIQLQVFQSSVASNKPRHPRTIVRVGDYKTGDTVSELKITGFGRSWKLVDCHAYTAEHGTLPPDWEGELIQYAYHE